MIDYEKLKEEGADNIHIAYLATCKRLGWSVKSENKVPYSELSDDAKELDIASFEAALQTLQKFGLIDEDKLRELTKPEPKYKIGDKIWVQSLKMECDNVLSMHAFEGTVIALKECDYGLSEPYVRVIAGNDEFCGAESFCFATRQALIEHQIDYWRNMLGEELEQHISNYCEPKPDCPKCHNYRNANNKLGYDCLCDELVTENSCDNVGTECDKCHNWKIANKLNYGCYCASMRNECQHEYPFGIDFKSQSARCIKCGEFYR